eukprot:TRINITY_DN5733_c0_g1_i1.p1 TRINITY_DN5733_c0_g1~~TRINITY_DN5733_c0_g1_i1.p1  ORF type:complete len:693 (-),score=116.07 TRINITY_DN5733_c0_g1_i1:139-2217(-)
MMFSSPQPQRSASSHHHKRNQSTISFADLDYDDKIKTIARRKQGQVQVILGKYQLKEKVGKGAFGIVYKGFEFETGKYVAIKRLKKEGIDEKALYNLKLEIELLKALDHPNIVKYLSLIDSDNHVNMILEFIDSGSLLQIIQKFGVLPENLAAVYTGQVLEGLQYLHAMDVIHRDIKASNILITSDGVIKLADFGIATTGEHGATADNSSFAEGSPFWMAPEVILLDPPSTACDIWSLGCTIIELVTGTPPYFDMPAMSALFRIAQEGCPPIPEHFSPDLKHILKNCFIREPQERPSAADLSNYSWINSGLSTNGDNASADMSRFKDDGTGSLRGQGGNESGGSSGSGRGSIRCRGTITSIDWGASSSPESSDRDSTGSDWSDAHGSFGRKVASASSLRVKDVAQSFEDFTFKESTGYVVLISGSETRKNKLFSYTVFRLRVCFGKESWRIFKTYTDFKELHLQVTVWLRQQKVKHKHMSGVKLPKFPGTKVFGAEKHNFVKKRKHQLQDYITALISTSEVNKAGFITNFLRTDGKDALSRDHGSESADDDEHHGHASGASSVNNSGGGGGSGLTPPASTSSSGGTISQNSSPSLLGSSGGASGSGNGSGNGSGGISPSAAHLRRTSGRSKAASMLKGQTPSASSASASASALSADALMATPSTVDLMTQSADWTIDDTADETETRMGGSQD